MYVHLYVCIQGATEEKHYLLMWLILFKHLKITIIITITYAHMVKSHHYLENLPTGTTNLIYNVHCALLLDYNKQLFHSKESLT